MKLHFELVQADLILVIVADGNNKVNPFLSGRVGIPAFTNLGVFTVYQFPPLRNESEGLYDIREIHASDEIASKFNSFNQHFQLGELIDAECLKCSRVLVAVSNGELVAAVALFDSSPYKQNVVIHASLFLRMLIRLSKFLPIPRLPGIGEPIKTLYIKNIFYSAGHETGLTELLAKSRQIASSGQYHFVSIGVHTKNPIQLCLKNLNKFTFKSRGFIASLKGNDSLLQDIICGVPARDYSLV
ncbi:MAG: hypothetical protein QM762_16135 [Chryseolinea sp.]